MLRYCPQCLKAKRACICQWITSVHCDSELIILQHSSEEKRPLGTAKILQLSLPNTRLFIGENFTDHNELNSLLSDTSVRTCVLFLSEQSTPISELVKNSDPRPLRIILLDGTWKKAFKMWTLSTNLHALPLVQLPLDLEGDYRIRKAPTSNALSTVEAGYHVLSILEPEQDFSSLIYAFEQMIEFHISQMPPGVFEQNYQ
ncbi:DTW domain-containing protein [Vibrio sp. 10N.286.49.C2]|uniref:tRNA-uridine aminocarboxypropyltransferase n=1 Tax=unclassified Vibrio TaxID=2614977 RepID=UPI000C81C732|nr:MULTISPECIES: DTW domain-containing protein [unclassified Vibrio]PMH33076.1 DTW domain-containing protein [Vibrio sp. 10N.286.49.C2]PMH48973.1 DTW domain-containing protein [Vibrio sp. 10N.286.49.B1]PMH78596.1 DTW domain-containing protein [Vibrio sp. 10N.286.48.B7]